MTRKHHLSVSTKDSQWTFPTGTCSASPLNLSMMWTATPTALRWMSMLVQVSGIVVKSSPSKGGLNHNEAFHLDKHNTVLQAEVFAVGKTATFLLDNKIEGSKIMINCDSQAAIRAIYSTVIKNSTSDTTLEATMALNTLGESNEITLRWIPAHCGYEGNELADQLTKRGSNNDRATRIKLPMPRCVCYAALRRKPRVSWSKSYKLNPPKMFNILWRDKFSKDLIRMNKRDLRAATHILTGMLVLIIILANLTALFNPSAHSVRRSMTLSPICWHNVQCFGSWESSSSTLTTPLSRT